MSEKDMQSKLFFGDNERFADFVNGSLYGGEQVVFADELEELNTEQVDKLQTRRRDILKRCKKDETVYAFFGTELQSTVDMMMPVRVMEYDAMSYRKMMENESKLYPLVTFCLYTGEKEWNKATSLYEMMNLPEGLKGIVQDYAIKVIQAKNADLSHYKNEEVREFFELFQDVHLMNRKELYEKYKDRELKSAEAVETVAVLGRCERLRDLIAVKKEGQKVCKNFDRIVKEWEEEAKAKGLAEGRTEGRAEGHAEGFLEGSKTAKQLEKLTTIDRLCKIGAELSLIAAASGLSVLEVEKIIQDNQFCKC